MPKIVAIDRENNHLLDEIELETRAGIKSDSVQNFLQSVKENNADIVCTCIEDNPLLTVSHLPKKKDKFTIKRRAHYEHGVDCIFHDKRDLVYDERKEKYKAAIFDEPKTQKKNGQYNGDDSEEEKVKRYTYKHFCIDMLAEGMSFAFNRRNHENDTTPTMYTTNEYFSALSIKFWNKTLANGEKVNDALPRGSKLTWGIIRESLDTAVNGGIILDEFNYNQQLFDSKTVCISDARLEITKNNHMNMANVLGGPYAYIAVYADEKIVRLYTYAIEEVGDKFSFVESGLEREYAREILDQDIAFIKPITGHEYETVANKRYANGERPDLKFRPDYIEYRDEGVCVVEVCGYPDDTKYMRTLEQKEQHYNSLQENGKISEYLRWTNH